MSNREFEYLHEQGRAQARERRKGKVQQTVRLLGYAATAAAACWGLNGIGFISDTFFCILAEGIALWGAYQLGGLWHR